ncbi:hypothetical protein WGM54_14210 [Paenibacillus polymyxa]|uniref:hypothetical protein n=1 Tax=Paenibacillus polymyxa TaxID=1406 RepID=UPI00307EFD3E
MAFMQGWEFVFAHKESENKLKLSESLNKNVPLASVDDLFKDKTLGIEKTYFVVKEGVYSFSIMHGTWFKS